MLGWTRQIQQRWTCSRACRSRRRGAPAAAALHSWSGPRSSRFWAHLILVFSAPVTVSLASGCGVCCCGLGGRASRLTSSCAAAMCSALLHTCPPINSWAAATIRFGLGLRLRRHHRAAVGPYGDMCLPQFIVSRRSLRALRSTAPCAASLWLPPRPGASK